MVSFDWLAQELQIPFSDEQRQAIVSPWDEPGLIVAGAGTGKTTVMAARAAWLVVSGAVQPEEILGLTFTRKATAELATRIDEFLTRAGIEFDQGPEVATYDAFAASIVREHGLRLSPGFSGNLIGEAEAYLLAGEVVSAWGSELPALGGFTPSHLVELTRKLDAQMQSNLCSSAAIRDTQEDVIRELGEAPPGRGGNRLAIINQTLDRTAQREELLDLVAAYRQRKLDHEVVEFADQLSRAIEVVEAFPQIRSAITQRHRVVMLDEYQDTSVAQVRLLSALFRDHPVMAVGDPCQAIYGWRGAAANTLAGFAEAFSTTSVPLYSLTTNRRSKPALVWVANELSLPLRGKGASSQPEKANGTPTTFADTGHGCDDHATSRRELDPNERELPQVLPLRWAKSEQRGSVTMHVAESRTAELEWLAEDLLDWAAGFSEPVWSSVAILARRNSELIECRAALIERGIPVELVGLAGLVSTAEVAPVLDTLRVLSDPTANVALTNLLTGPRWRIGAEDMALIGRHAATQAHETGAQPSLMDSVAMLNQVPLSERCRERLSVFNREMSDLRNHIFDPLLDLLRRVIATIGIEAELRAVGADTRQLDRLVDVAAAFNPVATPASLAGFLAYLDAEEALAEGLEQAPPSTSNAVQLLTMHRAKGLEWDRVYLPAWNDSLFPNVQVTDDWLRNPAQLPSPLRGDAGAIPHPTRPLSKDSIEAYHDELTEMNRAAERRLAYVAVTRAREHLLVSRHHWGTKVSPMKESEFCEPVGDTAQRLGAYRDCELPETNPESEQISQHAWPVPVSDDFRDRLRLLTDAMGVEEQHYELSEAEAELVRRIDEDLELLAAQASRIEPEPQLPDVMSASQLLAFAKDPEAFRQDLIRPMPRKPSATSGVGITFHEWVADYFGQPSETLFELDGELEPEPASQPLRDKFLASVFAGADPVAVEHPFAAPWRGRIIRGRIDAVFDLARSRSLAEQLGLQDARYLVVDWKTGTTADPTQLALYRWAWAMQRDVAVDQVAAGFYHVAAARFEPHGADGPELLDALAEVAKPGH